ncbi:MAG TPA: methionine ABC transporter ATP-binding protein [Gammaproteobacteria bacterium]|nr:methionine ABC transporter ATP-binding protein [Gammaproteobacteria bacterium]
MIELHDLNKSYRLADGAIIPALIDVQISVKRGEIFGIIGESGAGKSTLIRCVNLLEIPNSGKVIVDDQELTALNKKQLRLARRKIGMIFQHFNLINCRTVYQNIAFPLELAGFSKSEIAKKVQPLLELTGLSERKNYYPSQLSGGQKQRVAIARALANDPIVLLSDEATSALDPETRHSILHLLKEINERMGLTILLITHEMQVIKEICHRLAILEHGRVIEQAEVFNFFTRPQTATSKKFIRSYSMHELPESLQTHVSTVPLPESAPLWRLSFFGKVAQEPMISHLARHYSLNLNILQANIEEVRDTMVGVMMVEVQGEPENAQQGIEYLTQKGVFVEVLGYVSRSN